MKQFIKSKHQFKTVKSDRAAVHARVYCLATISRDTQKLSENHKWSPGQTPRSGSTQVNLKTDPNALIQCKTTRAKLHIKPNQRQQGMNQQMSRNYNFKYPKAIKPNQHRIQLKVEKSSPDCNSLHKCGNKYKCKCKMNAYIYMKTKMQLYANSLKNPNVQIANINIVL